MVLRFSRALRLLVLALVPAIGGCAVINDDLSGANARVPLEQAVAAGAAPEAAGYYVEFRARPSIYLSGHAYVVYGPQDAAGRPLEENITGFFPKYHMLGFIGGMLAMPGEVDEIKLDRVQRPLVTYRKVLTGEEYQKLVEFIAEAKHNKKMWNMFFRNCNDFVGAAAKVVGLKTPLLTFVPTPAYVLAIRELNPS